MKKSITKLLPCVALVLAGTVHAASAQEIRPSTSSAENSPKPATRANRALAACAAAVDELAASRTLIAALEAESSQLKTRLATEKQTTELLGELNESRKAEAAALHEAVAAKNDALAAKDAVIATQDRLIATLKTRKTSIWKRIGDIAIGAAAAAVLK
jgi:uncharacterized protein YicC (UPF0701 family)